jgi:hypothetical protein
MEYLHQQAKIYKANVLDLAITVTVISSLVLVSSLYMLVKAVRLKENNIFFIMLFSLISLSLVCIFVIMWAEYILVGLLASENYMKNYLPKNLYRTPLYVGLVAASLN